MTRSHDDRVRGHTSDAIKAQLDDQMRDRLFHYSVSDDDQISERIAALDEEWDLERYLEVLAPALALAGVALGARRGRKWLLLSATVLGFSLQHALQGWCPPFGLLRRMSIRTRREIEQERYALKALRGDFSGLPPDAPYHRATRVDAVLDAVKM